MEWLETLVLGVVQGITEFLPVSSDGHLNVFTHLFARFTGNMRSQKENIFFDVMLHIGTLVAILAHYRREIFAGIRGFFGDPKVPDAYRRNPVIHVGLLAIAATLWLIPVKLFLMKTIEDAFGSMLATGVGFLITASVLLITVSRLSGGDKGPRETTLVDALLVGLAQAFAPLPGVSRSGLTIAAALALGFRRAWAVQFSLMLAVPAIVGAAVFEIKHVDRATLTTDRIAQTLIAMILAGLVGYAAIVWLARVVRAGRLWYFSVYLVVLGVAVIAAYLLAGDAPSGKEATSSLDRQSWAEPLRSRDRGVFSGDPKSLCRLQRTDERETFSPALATDVGCVSCDGVDLG